MNELARGDKECMVLVVWGLRTNRLQLEVSRVWERVSRHGARGSAGSVACWVVL